MKAGLPSYTEDMKPVILHSDMNNFYASVEILHDPTLRDKPVAVAGDEEARHGIVLAKNDIAKRFGIRTGQVLWEARQQCPGLVCVPAHYERYLAFSAQAREIYTSYTDQVESFGLDECWLDVTGSVGLFGEGPAIADDIRGRMKRELAQANLIFLTANTLDIWETAVGLFRRHHTGREPVRSLLVKASGLTPADGVVQLSLFPEEQKAQRRADIDRALDKIRGKYGYRSIRWAIALVDPALDLDAKEEHIINPTGFLHR